MKPSGKAPKGPPMTPGPSHRLSSPPRTRLSLSRLFHQAVSFPSVLINSSSAPMSSEPSPTKRKRTEPSPTPESHEDSSTASSNLLRVQRHSSATHVPTRGSPHAVGYDLYSAEATRVPAQGWTLIDTQLLIAVPQDTYGRVAPRSGLASQCAIDVGAGVIDPDYRGVVFVLLLNHNDHDFEVNIGDRIAQLVLERISTPAVVEVLDFDTMPSSPSTPFLETADLERSPSFEIEDTTPRWMSPSPPAP